MLYTGSHRSVSFVIAVSFLFFFLLPLFSFSQANSDSVAIFVLKGNTRFASTAKADEGVDLELKKNGQTISKMKSGKNGKYYIQMDVSTTDKNCEYLLYISQEGTVSKTVSINTYVSQQEFNARPFPRYDYTLEIKMTEATEKDIIVEKASARIHWDSAQRGFAFDQTFAKLKQKEEDDPNKFLAEKKKKEEDEARRKTDEDARLKADADEKALAEQKAKEEKENAERIIKKDLEAWKQELRRKRLQDSIDSTASAMAGKAAVEIKKFAKPVSAEDVDPNAFDGTSAFSINIAMRSAKAARERMNREKASNLSAKYETNNTLTSLLNMVDEDEQNQKIKVKSIKQ